MHTEIDHLMFISDNKIKNNHLPCGDLRSTFCSPPLPSDTATPGAYTFCPTLAMATTAERLNPRTDAGSTKNRQFLPTRT
jgi:hypothetical protein